MAKTTHYGHVEPISLPNHIFPGQAFSSKSCAYSFARNRQLLLLNQHTIMTIENIS